MALIFSRHVDSPLAEELPLFPCDPAGEHQGEEGHCKHALGKCEEEVKAGDHPVQNEPLLRARGIPSGSEQTPGGRTELQALDEHN